MIIEDKKELERLRAIQRETLRRFNAFARDSKCRLGPMLWDGNELLFSRRIFDETIGLRSIHICVLEQEEVRGGAGGSAFLKTTGKENNVRLLSIMVDPRNLRYEVLWNLRLNWLCLESDENYTISYAKNLGLTAN